MTAVTPAPAPLSDEAWERGIFEMVRFVRRFSRELAELLQALDEILGSKGWECPQGNKGVVWGSGSYDRPEDWLCTFPMRLWQRKARAIQVVLDFEPPEGFDAPAPFQRPLIECGVHHVGKRFDAKKQLTAAWVGTPWTKGAWTIEGWEGPLVRARPRVDSSDKRIVREIIDRTAGYYLPLRAVRDEATLRRLVVEPLLALAEGDAIPEAMAAALSAAGAIVP